jgi:hypothetical protein
MAGKLVVCTLRSGEGWASGGAGASEGGVLSLAIARAAELEKQLECVCHKPLAPLAVLPV